MLNRVIGLHFSPTGRLAEMTEKMVHDIADRLNESCASDVEFMCIDLLKDSLENPMEFDEDTVVVLGVGVYTGRIPLPLIKRIQRLHGNGAMMVGLVTYGNTSYGDSLYELCTFAEEQGFRMISAGAFIARHPMFEKIADHRPDSDDYAKLREFARCTSDKITRLSGCLVGGLRIEPAPLEVKGSMPRKGPVKLPLHPVPNADCINCGECARICPTGAISIDDVAHVNTRKCILCSACMTACPEDARGLFGPMAEASRLAMEVMYRRRKEPEWFL